MKFGLLSIESGPLSGPALGEVAQLAESVGFDSLWFAEHMAIPPLQPGQAGRTNDTGMLDPILALTYVAARTRRLKLGTGVLILPQHPPLWLAKQLASLDVLSQGRLLAGVGLGHVESELNALGVQMSERGARADEYLEAMIELWTKPLASYSGRFVSFSNLGAYPRPVTQPHVHIVMGGRVERAHRRAARFASGWYGYGQTPETAADQIRSLDEACRRYDRPGYLGRLEITVHPKEPFPPQHVRAFEGLGVDRILLRLPNEHGQEQVERFIEDTARALL